MGNHPCAQCSPTGELTAFPMGPQGLPARQTNPPGSGWLQCTASFPGLYPAQLEPPHGTASTQTEPVQRRDTCCQCHQRQTTQRAWGQHSWETEMCSTSSSTAWHPQCPHYTHNTGGHWLLCSALPLLAVSWTRLCLHDGTHSSPPHMLLLCLPSHWACSSRFFQIISFLAPAFTK